MKVIFLDHQWTMYLKNHKNDRILDDFDEKAINILNKILDITNSEIVISSDWKFWVSLEEMQIFYKKQNILKCPISYTGFYEPYEIDIIAKQRSQEIKNWLKENQFIEKWVAVDDLDMRNYLDNFVYISNKTEGITQLGIMEKIIEYVK